MSGSRVPRGMAGAPGIRGHCAKKMGRPNLRNHRTWEVNWRFMQDTVPANAATESGALRVFAADYNAAVHMPMEPHAGPPCESRQSLRKAARASLISVGWGGVAELDGPTRSAFSDLSVSLRKYFFPNVTHCLFRLWKGTYGEQAKNAAKDIQQLAQLQDAAPERQNW